MNYSSFCYSTVTPLFQRSRSLEQRWLFGGISHLTKKISIPDKSPSPKNPGNKQSRIPKFLKNPHFPGRIISGLEFLIFKNENFLKFCTRVPNPSTQLPTSLFYSRPRTFGLIAYFRLRFL